MKDAPLLVASGVLLVPLGVVCLYMTLRSERSFREVQAQGDPALPPEARDLEIWFHGLFPKAFAFLAGLCLSIGVGALILAGRMGSP